MNQVKVVLIKESTNGDEDTYMANKDEQPSGGKKFLALYDHRFVVVYLLLPGKMILLLQVEVPVKVPAKKREGIENLKIRSFHVSATLTRKRAKNIEGSTD